jgi:hypothetical protein
MVLDVIETPWGPALQECFNKGPLQFPFVLVYLDKRRGFNLFADIF